MSDPREYSIEVYCDDRRHTRGKIAKVATLILRSDGHHSVDVRRPGEGERAVRKAETGQVRDRNALARSVLGTEAIRCKLCGRHLPPGCGIALHEFITRYAGPDAPPIQLAKLAAIVSSQAGH